MGIYKKLKNFYKKYQGEKGVIGFSEKSRPLYYFCVKKSDFPVVIVQYAIHAREYITTLLALKQIKHFERVGKKGCVYFIPAVNPDGIYICEKHNPLYKANANGVDLNVNFDAKWGTGKNNVFIKSASDFVGECPFSEAETRALRAFTLLKQPKSTISYHSKGEEIYWEFFQTGKRRNKDKRLAELLSKETGYKLKSTPFSAGGYKDWCIEKLLISAFTIEVGKDKYCHPLNKSKLKQIYKKNKNVIKVITENV